MIPFPLTFLKGLSPTTWIIGGMSIAIVVLSGSLWVQGVRLDSAKNDIQELTIINKDLNSKITKQNEGISALVETSKELEKNLAAAAEINKKRKQELEIALNTIKNQPIPKDTQGRLDYLLNSMKEFATKWNSEKQ